MSSKKTMSPAAVAEKRAEAATAELDNARAALAAAKEAQAAALATEQDMEAGVREGRNDGAALAVAAANSSGCALRVAHAQAAHDTAAAEHAAAQADVNALRLADAMGTIVDGSELEQQVRDAVQPAIADAMRRVNEHNSIVIEAARDAKASGAIVGACDPFAFIAVDTYHRQEGMTPHGILYRDGVMVPVVDGAGVAVNAAKRGAAAALRGAGLPVPDALTVAGRATVGHAVEKRQRGTERARMLALTVGAVLGEQAGVPVEVVADGERVATPSLEPGGVVVRVGRGMAEEDGAKGSALVAVYHDNPDARVGGVLAGVPVREGVRGAGGRVKGEAHWRRTVLGGVVCDWCVLSVGFWANA